MVLHGSCVFCELFFRSSSFPARVRAQVHVRSDLDASAVSPFFFSGPFPPFSGPFGVSVSPCVRTPSSSSQPGPWRMVHSSFSCKFQLPFPLGLPCASLVPCQAAMFQVPRRSGLSPSCTVRRPQVTSASCLLPPGLRSWRSPFSPALVLATRATPCGLPFSLGSGEVLACPHPLRPS